MWCEVSAGFDWLRVVYSGWLLLGQEMNICVAWNLGKFSSAE
jgi:hypothetical protein